jgi:hypothetical protein
MMGLLDGLLNRGWGGLLDAPVNQAPPQRPAPLLVPPIDGAYGDGPLDPWNTNPSSLGKAIGGLPGDPASLAKHAIDAPVAGVPHLGSYAYRPTASSWPSPGATAPLALVPPARPSEGPSSWTQAPTGNPFARLPNGGQESPGGRLALAGTASRPTTPNLTAQALRTRGVAEADIAAALDNPERMKQLIYQNFGPGSAGAPGFRSPNQIQPSISGVSASSATAQPENSKPPSDNAPVHLAQVFAFPPVSLFARPPVYVPRQLTPLEDLPSGSANGPRAGMDFLRNEGKPKTPDEYPPCTYCGEKTAPGRFHRDHIIPRSRGGDGSESNRTPACPSCNVHKGARTPEEWYIYMKNGGT